MFMDYFGRFKSSSVKPLETDISLKRPGAIMYLNVPTDFEIPIKAQVFVQIK